MDQDARFPTTPLRLSRSDPAREAALASGIRAALAATAEDTLVVVCAPEAPEVLGAARAALAAGRDVEPWHYREDGQEWREPVGRLRRLRRLKQPRVLITTPAWSQLFGAELLEACAQVLHLTELAGESPSGEMPAIAPDRTLYLATAGTTRAPRSLAIPYGVLAKRVAARAALTQPGPILRALPLHGGAACEALASPGEDAVWLDPSAANADPLSILRAVAQQAVGTLQITAGQLLRLLREAEAAPSLPETPSLALIEISGGPLPAAAAERLRDLLAPGAGGQLRLRGVYRSLETGAIAQVEVPAGQVFPRDGRHVIYPDPVGATALRIVDAEFTPLAAGEVGEIQVRHDGCLARAIRNPNGKLTPLADASGAVKPGDRGAMTAAGLIVTSATGEQIIVPRRSTSVAELEAQLRDMPGVMAESIVVLRRKTRKGTPPGLDVVFSPLGTDPAEMQAAATTLFSTVMALTNVQPSIYRVRGDQTPLDAGLSVRRSHIEAMIGDGRLRPTVAPATFETPSPEAALHECRRDVAEIWQEVLELPEPPAPDADFFALGADSLNLTTMLEQVEGRYDVSLETEAFFAAPTVAGLADLLLQSAPTPPPAPLGAASHGDGADALGRMAEFTRVWRGARTFDDSLIRSANLDGTRPPLFWILQSEGTFLLMAESLGPDQPFHALRSAVGVVDHYTEATLAAITDRYLWEILAKTRGQPFYLGGNCQGAIIALLLARRLRDAGQAPERLIMMEWFFDFGGYDGPTVFLTGEDSFVAELQLTAPSLQDLSRQFPLSEARDIPGAHGQFFREGYLPGVIAEIRRAMEL